MIHRALLVALPMLLAGAVAAQTVTAVTSDGRRIVVHEDGTWDAAPPPPPAPPLDAAPPAPPSPPRAVRVETLEGGAGTYRLRYDASRWSPSTAHINAEAEYGFALPFGAGYAMTIYEVTPFPLDVMRDIVIGNAEAGTDGQVTILSEEKVNVEGGTVLRLEFEVDIPGGMSVTFINSIQSNDAGTLQVVTWTATPVMKRFRDELVQFHDGLSLIPQTSDG